VNDTPTRAYLSRKEAADYLSEVYFPISAMTLARYAAKGTGPIERMRPGGSQALYLRDDLDTWAKHFPTKVKPKPHAGALSGAKR